MKKLLLVLASVSACKSVPKCNDFVTEQMAVKKEQGLVPLATDSDQGAQLYIWTNKEMTEADGLVFVPESHPEFKTENLDLGAQTEMGTCKLNDVNYRIVNFKMPMPGAI